MGPQASKMSPRASKITQNHENLVTQNQENPRKKTSRNGTVAGYARSALDILKSRATVLTVLSSAAGLLVCQGYLWRPHREQ